ncbi:MAG TPA: hypothetical protein VNH41_04210 [Steroidobacteraceae bacterium]|nr:hypothetical protein [Steroidobacteraceae bacterium]
MVEPRVALSPGGDSQLGDEAVDFCKSHGLELDDWQAMVLRESLLTEGKKWSAFEIGAVLPRQNGKGAIIEARELVGLFMLGEELTIHSAHQFDTSLEAFMRMEFRIDGSDELRRQVKRVTRSHGEEGITVIGGARLRYRTRTKGGGRGFTCDCLILDEAMYISEMMHGALLPTLSAKSVDGNPQVWYTGSAVDQMVHEHGVVLSRVRERAIKGEEGLAYFEWSLEHENPDLVEETDAASIENQKRANPALGIRISEKHIDAERRSMDPRTFAVERLGVGDWPPTSAWSSVIDLEKWQNATDAGSKIVGPVSFAFDVRPDRSASTIAAAGKRADGKFHVEIIERRKGTGWVVQRLLELRAKWDTSAIVCDAIGPAASLVADLERENVEVTLVNSREMAEACGVFYDAVEEGTLRHLGTAELLASLRGAAQRSLGDAWAWSRKNSAVDISPLVGCTLALWSVAVARTQEVFAAAW